MFKTFAEDWKAAIHHFDKGEFDQSEKILIKLYSLNFKPPQLLHLLGICQFRLGKPGAETLLQNALTALPGSAAIWSDLGNIFKSKGAFHKAIECYLRGLTISGHNSDILCNLGAAYISIGDFIKAERCFKDALTLSPDFHLARYNLGVLQLSCENFKDGWNNYKSRWDAEAVPAKHRGFFLPELSNYDLENVTTQKLWVWSEQGIGDEILYMSVVNDAVANNINFKLGCSARLTKLVRRSFPKIEVLDYEADDCLDKINDCTAQIPLVELCGTFRQRIEAFPGRPYLLPDINLKTEIRLSYLSATANNISANNLSAKKLVGISWGSQRARSGHFKTIPLTEWGEIFRIPNVQFISLQYGETKAELEYICKLHNINVLEDPAIDPLGDIDLFAAQISAMDAVVTVSNSTAHIAGAIGIPTVVMLPESDGLIWYWFRNRNLSPWYSSLNLIRRDSGMGWKDVVLKASNYLRSIIQPNVHTI